jgi:hypothetical protein
MFVHEQTTGRMDSGMMTAGIGATMCRHSSRSSSRAATRQRSTQVVAHGCVRMLSDSLRLLCSTPGAAVAGCRAPVLAGHPVLSS